MNHSHEGLPAYLAPGLSILFVGINPGIRSAKVGHHFAGPSNRFWKLLFEARLLPFPINHQDDWRMPNFGYGPTNAIARPTAGVQDLRTQDFLDGRQALHGKIMTYRPRLVALLGVSMARILLSLEHPEGKREQPIRHPLQAGMQCIAFSGAPVFVLPNPSGRNAHYSYPRMKELFCELNRVARHSKVQLSKKP
jgi:double-stranded uracil-DNA glycosylase